MALEKIRLGTPPDGKDGDDGRTAFTRINENFSLMDRIGLTAEIGRATVDFNQATDPGWYYDANNTAQNKPPLAYAVVFVIRRPGGFVIQEARSITAGNTATRILNGNSGSWTAWAAESGGAIMPAATNLNSLAGLTGEYTFNDDAANRPPNIAYGAVQTLSRSINETIQVAWQVNGFNQARRNFIGGSWTAWRDTTPNGIGAYWIGYGSGGSARAVNTWYQTLPGKCRVISIFGGPSTAANAGYRILTAAGADLRGNYSAAGQNYVSTYAEIPPDTSYQVQHINANSTAPIILWHELDR